MSADGKILIGKSTKPEYLALRLANRHGLVTGATGTGKTVTLPVIDLKDLRALLNHCAENEKEIDAKYGNVAKQSIGAIQRQLLMLENQGAASFFGEPALDIRDFMKTDRDGRGIVNILAADRLMAKPRLYASFLLWMLSELFEELPEVGDLDKPKLVFFFDEAHLLFNDAPRPLLEAVEQVVRLIRSKGVGVYFVTQNPLDVPDTVLAQLGNRVQHALRAFTPRDQKAVRAAAETFRQNPAFSTETVITQLGVGEALVSTLEGNGTPSMVERTLIAPPSARVGPLTEAERADLIKASPLRGKYDQAVDSESAYEMLAKRKEMAAEPAQQAASSGGLGGLLESVLGGGQGSGNRGGKGKGRQRMTMTETVVRSAATSAARTVGTQIGRAILRNVLGSIMKGR
jgi:DNA helicase HerA-like ATPase